MTSCRPVRNLVVGGLFLCLLSCNGGGVPPNGAPTLEQVRALYLEGKPREALDAALSMADDPPVELVPRVALAQFLSRHSASVRAVEILDAWAGDIGVAGREVLASALLRSGRTARASDLLLELSAAGGSPGTSKLLGMAACGRRDWPEAVRHLSESRVGGPADPECLAWLGWARICGGKPERGVRLLRDGLRDFPDSWEIRSMLAAALFRLQPEDEFALREVVTLTEWVSARHPFDRESRARLGAALGRLERHAGAEEVLAGLVSDYPSVAAYRVDLGIAQVRAGRPLRAVATMEQAARVAPKDTRVLLNLALAYLEAASHAHDAVEFAAKAKGTFALVRDLDQRSVDALIGLARATVKSDPSDNQLVREAIGYYQDALKIEPGSFPANLNVALLYYDLTVHSAHAVEVRDAWYMKALEHFRAAEAAVDASQWHRAAREAYETLKSR